MYQRRQWACTWGWKGAAWLTSVLASHHATESPLKAARSRTKVQFIIIGRLPLCACVCRSAASCCRTSSKSIAGYFRKMSMPGFIESGETAPQTLASSPHSSEQVALVTLRGNDNRDAETECQGASEQRARARVCVRVSVCVCILLYPSVEHAVFAVSPNAPEKNKLPSLQSNPLKKCNVSNTTPRWLYSHSSQLWHVEQFPTIFYISQLWVQLNWTAAAWVQPIGYLTGTLIHELRLFPWLDLD